MKYVMYAIVLALSVPLYSQEIRLDSLWIKMGGYPVMAFSPDSKVLVLGSEILEPVKGAIRFFEVETGKQLDSITKISFIDFGFSPSDGNLYIVTTTSIDVYDKQRMLVRRMPYTKGGLLSFSPDGSLLLMTGEGKIRLVKSENAEVVREITRPSSYKGSNNQDIPFNNGRVNFNSDGTLLYGKNAEEFGSWDLTKANTPFVRKMTIGNRAVIGFTPDNRYMVQQSNYIWDLNTKTQVQIEGKKDFDRNYAIGFTSTTSSQIIVTLKEDPEPLTLHVPLFIDISKKRIITTNPIRYYTTQMLLSNDSNYLVRQLGSGSVLLNKVQWSTTTIQDEINTNPSVSISPIPGKESLQLYIHLRQASPSFDVKIHDISGKYIETLYSGSVELGEQRYTLDTKSYSSGKYYVVLSNNGSIQSYPFLITK
ncbi:MAG: hypothetical protein J0M05_05805 [Candidatus Kapabacteria bacterium]|nr:hypothetical protein [Candidatus Kapabacteria bacterium]